MSPRSGPSLSSLLLLAACAHAPARPSSAPACSALTDEIRQQASEAEAFTLGEYRAALARAGLTPITLPSRYFAGTGGGRVDIADADNFHAVGTVVTEGNQQLVAGPYISVPNGQLPQPSFEFVKDEAGTIFQLERDVQVLSTGNAVLCGCGPVGSGAAPHVEQLLYELPAGATYGGVVRIAYAAKLYTFGYSGTDARGKGCQPPP